ncbi:hypothetical protein ACIHEI_12490 [Kitasatospora sp. NPDC051984]|uniref:hypothetical protein n=1 Tax=Kitasatospora sp. NPDC051984 TaxID=3364059 RepID=UPI0037C549A8
MNNEGSVPPAGQWPRLPWSRRVLLAITLLVGLVGGWLTGRHMSAAPVLGPVTFAAFMALALAGRKAPRTRAPMFGGWTAAVVATLTFALGAAAGAADLRPLALAAAAAVWLVQIARKYRERLPRATDEPREQALRERPLDTPQDANEPLR